MLSCRQNNYVMTGDTLFIFNFSLLRPDFFEKT